MIFLLRGFGSLSHLRLLRDGLKLLFDNAAKDGYLIGVLFHGPCLLNRRLPGLLDDFGVKPLPGDEL